MDKACMRRHFMRRLKCPAQVNDIDLTEEIKQYILDNRFYVIPKQMTSLQTINNYNIMNNFISNLDPLTKLDKVIKYKNANLIPFDTSIDFRFQDTRLKLENDQGHHAFRDDDIFGIIDNITKVSDNVEDFNLIYDSKKSKVMIYESGDWKDMFLLTGLRTIIKTIQDYFWNAYECYLIRKIKTSRQLETRDLLKEYYVFLASLDIEPFVKNKTDNKILYNADDDEYWSSTNEDYYLSDEFSKFFKDVRDGITTRERDKWKQLVHMIKKNCQNNVEEVNKLVLSIIKVDDDFKHDLMSITTGIAPPNF